jgi:hypothetical protein
MRELLGGGRNSRNMSLGGVPLKGVFCAWPLVFLSLSLSLSLLPDPSEVSTALPLTPCHNILLHNGAK